MFLSCILGFCLARRGRMSPIVIWSVAYWELRRGPSQTHLSGSAFAVSGEPQHRICGFSTVGHAGVVSHWDLPLTFGFLVHLSERETTAIAGTLLSARADHAIVT